MYNQKSMTGGRLGVNETVYYHAASGEQKAYVSRYAARCVLDEKPYERNLRVTQEWQQLDTGWFKDYPGKEPEEMLLINEEGSLLQRIPTEEEKASITSRVVEVGIGNRDGAAVCPIAKIKPGRSLRYSPQEVGRVWLRCRKGVARVSLVLIPE